jgi:hypothetical protein
MSKQITRTPYQAPKLEVQRLRDLPSALATSGCRNTGTPGSCDNSQQNMAQHILSH